MSCPDAQKNLCFRQMSLLPSTWASHLYDDFEWLANSDEDPLRDIVDKIIDIVNGNDEQPITSVYESSIWAVCMLYLHFLDGNILEASDVSYAHNRGGVIGVIVTGESVEMLSLKSYLCYRDIGFWEYVTGQKAVVGA